MNIIKGIFARIWAFWALLFFVTTMFVAYIFYIPCHFLKEPQKAIWHRRVSRIWMWCFLQAVGCPFKVKGLSYFDHLTNCVIVCNHNSLMDIPVTTPFMARANKTIARKDFAVVPVFGWIYGFGSVLVDRKSDASRRRSFEDMKRMLSHGLDMVIYPEGTRNRTDKPLKSFYDGAFRLAAETKKPVVPAIVFNTRKVLPVHKTFYMLPHRLEMHFLPPVESDNISSKELREKVFKMMWDYYEANANAD
jgi:1-acyl-sn-glycerol-3-phosphate acyltransferase